jgi:hypothetical protein
MDGLSLSLAHLESKCTNIYDAAEVERVYYPEIEKLLLEFEAHGTANVRSATAAGANTF